MADPVTPLESTHFIPLRDVNFSFIATWFNARFFVAFELINHVKYVDIGKTGSIKGVMVECDRK